LYFGFDNFIIFGCGGTGTVKLFDEHVVSSSEDVETVENED
jgi:hypothetical protein